MAYICVYVYVFMPVCACVGIYRYMVGLQAEHVQLHTSVDGT
jgi:hypothetical protein